MKNRKENELIESNDSESVKQTSKKSSIFLIILVLVVISLVVLIFCLFTQNNPNNNSTSSGHNQSTNSAQNKKLVSYTNTYLPGFEITYDSMTWELKEKPFSDIGSKMSRSGDTFICEKDCMSVDLNKNNISLEIFFRISLEDIGYLRCSNSAEFKNVGNNWYRIKNKLGYFYSYGVNSDNYLGAKVNHIDTEGECQQSSSINISEMSGNDWSCVTNTQYKICDSGHGVFLTKHSSIKVGLDGSGVPIIVEEPRIIGNPDVETLTEIDEIITSIRGLSD